MNRNNKENIRVNAVLVLGEIERMKLDHSNQLPTINLLENNQQKNGTFNSPFTPTKIYSQNNSIAVIDCKSTLIKKMTKPGLLVNPLKHQLIYPISSKTKYTISFSVKKNS